MKRYSSILCFLLPVFLTAAAPPKQAHPPKKVIPAKPVPAMVKVPPRQFGETNLSAPLAAGAAAWETFKEPGLFVMAL